VTTRRLPEHGTRTRYTRYRCKCELCVAAERAYKRDYRERNRARIRAYAREHYQQYRRYYKHKSPFVPRGEVLPHVERLLAAGMTMSDIARAAGLSHDAVRRVVRGEGRWVRSSTRDALLRAKPTPRIVPALGARRRLRALAALGWATDAVAAEAGFSHHTAARILSGRVERIAATTHEAVCGAYDRLSMRLGPSRRAANAARRKGWAPPLAWDDERLDDPEATADLGAQPDRGVDFDDLVLLIEAGGTWEQLERRLGVTVRTIEKRLVRHGRGDLISRLHEQSGDASFWSLRDRGRAA